MTNKILNIENLSCSYNGSAPILEIENVQIFQNEFVAILGQSGSGKSTLLETLGLMNNTISNGDVHFVPNGDEGYSFKKLWGNKSLISNLRNKHLSFIFQDTNLMPNFNICENVCMSQIIQGLSYSEAKKRIQPILNDVGLQDIDCERDVSSLSGGQKQRVAFVRAVSPDFTILFGDEPTGNLDENNANELLAVIHRTIKTKKRTAIIVTHDISKAVKYADRILVIRKNKSESVGRLDMDSVYLRTNENIWSDSQGNKISSLKDHLVELMYK